MIEKEKNSVGGFFSKSDAVFQRVYGEMLMCAKVGSKNAPKHTDVINAMCLSSLQKKSWTCLKLKFSTNNSKQLDRISSSG